MKNNIVEALTIYSKEGSPDTLRTQLLQKLNWDSDSFSQADYIKARALGLTISEARDAIKLASFLKTEGAERLLKAIPGISLKYRRKNESEEPPLKKKRPL
jgi:hypothetical protein